MDRVAHRRRALLLLPLWLAVLAAPVAAQDVVIDHSQAPITAPTVQVTSAGQAVPITILKGTAKPDAVLRVAVTPFLSATGERLLPQISTNASAQGEREVVIPKGTWQIQPLYLIVPAPPGPGPFTGNLFVLVDGAPRPGGPFRQPVSITALTPSRPATLQIVPDADTRSHEIGNPFSRNFSPGQTLNPADGPVFDIRLGDTNRTWPITVDVGPAAVTKSPDNLNVSDHAAYYDANGKRLPLPFEIPPEGRNIKMQLGGLPAGEYTFALPFIGQNAAAEPKKLTMTVNVRHSIWYALLCLLVALTLSFIASKAVSIRAERLKLQNRIAELRPFWLLEEPPTMAVVWVQSIVAQANRLSKRWLLPSLDTINTRLDTAGALLLQIDRLRRARVEIRQAVLPPFVSARAFKLAERIGDRLDPEMGPADLTEIAKDITDLRAWTRQGDDVEARYVADLSTSIKQLLAVVDLKVIPEAHRQKLEALVVELNKPMPKGTALEERERVFAALKIAWERREADEFAALVGVLDQGIDQIFKVSDDTAWQRLKTQAAHVSFGLASHRGGQPAEAFDPLIFRFTAGTLALDRTFLVMHGLTYKWEFVVKNEGGQVEIKRSTRGPQVPLFAPFAGTMAPSLRLVYPAGKDEFPVAHAPVTITKSAQFAAYKGVSGAEVLQWVLAFVVAAITGLQQLYFARAGFGSLADYMGLFAWGATVDQAKNLLQRTQAPANSEAKPPATVPAPPPAEGAGARGTVQPKPPAEGAGGAQNPAPPNPAAPGGQPAAKPPVPPIADPPRPAFLNLSDIKIKKPEDEE